MAHQREMPSPSTAAKTRPVVLRMGGAVASETILTTLSHCIEICPMALPLQSCRTIYDVLQQVFFNVATTNLIIRRYSFFCAA